MEKEKNTFDDNLSDEIVRKKKGVIKIFSREFNYLSFLNYVFFSISLLSIVSGLSEVLSNEFDDYYFREGLMFLAFGFFTCFILWKNNFFKRNKS